MAKLSPDFYLYYSADYLKIQNYKQLESILTNEFESHFSIKPKNAISLTQSPMGGIRGEQGNSKNLKFYLKTINQQLKERDIESIILSQPPLYYTGFVADEELISEGWKLKYFEWNQYINLKEEIILHPMQLRHLRKKQSFTLRQLNHEHLAHIHTFITQCRKSQDLEINISKEKLMALTEAFPECFDLHVVELGDRIISAVIMVKPTNNTCYYYLPATDPEFTKMSPMVHLLHHLYGHYGEQGFDYMDLGVSSIHGKKQAGLFDFKQRMGAKAVKKLLLEWEVK